MIKTIYLKELKDAIRDGKTLVLSVFLPLLMIVGMVFFYEQLTSRDAETVYDIAVDQSIEPAALEWLSSLEAIQVHQSEDPLHAVEQGEVRAALFVSDGFEARLNEGQTIELEIHADQTSQKSAEAVEQLMFAIERKQAEIVEDRLTQIGVEIEQIKPFQTTVHSLHAGNEASLMLVSMLLSVVIVLSVMLSGMIPYFTMIGVSPSELSSIDFVIPFLNIYALLKELIYGIFHWQSLLLVTASSLVFIVICFTLASWMFKKDKWVLGK